MRVCPPSTSVSRNADSCEFASSHLKGQVLLAVTIVIVMSKLPAGWRAAATIGPGQIHCARCLR